MTALYSQFKSFNQSYSRISQSMFTRSMLLLVISTAFTSFFLSLFIVIISFGLLPFTSFRLWLVKRKGQKYTDNNTQYPDFINVNEQSNRVIEAEYTVIKSDSDKIKH